MTFKTCVVTVASRQQRGYRLFYESCQRFGIEPIVLGLGLPYTSNVDKLVYLRDFLADYGGEFTHILFCDAYDVIIGGPLGQIEQVYLSFDSPVIFSAEKQCWPDNERTEDYPPGQTPYRFLNSGLWIGEIGAIRELIESIQAARSISLDFYENTSDQRLFTSAFLSGKAPIGLDYQCLLFQSLHGAVEDIVVENGRLRNALTDTHPLIFHGNGNSSLHLVLTHFRLLPPIEESFRKALRGQMSDNQYRYIDETIRSNAARRTLVIGTGFDTELWYQSSKGNLTCVEDNSFWFPELPCEIIVPEYRGQVGKWLADITVPPLLNRCWDFAIVDGPNGYDPTHFGRQEPIYWASLTTTAIVMVHDYDRDWERKVCDFYLGRPIEIIPFPDRSDRVLAVFQNDQAKQKSTAETPGSR